MSVSDQPPRPRPPAAGRPTPHPPTPHPPGPRPGDPGHAGSGTPAGGGPDPAVEAVVKSLAVLDVATTPLPELVEVLTSAQEELARRLSGTGR